MKNIIFVVIMPLVICLSGCVPLWVMNQPEQVLSPRPLDIQNIFYTDRLVGDSVKYFKNKVVFIADVSADPYFKSLEVFIADKDGRNNLQRVTFATSSNSRNYISFAKNVDLAFDESRIFVVFGKVYHDPNPFFFEEELTGNPLILLEPTTGNKIFEKNVEAASIKSPDKKKIVFVAQDGAVLSIYVIGEDMNFNKIADLPIAIQPNKGPRTGKEYLAGMKWDGTEIALYTNQILPGFWSGWLNRFREYRINADGSNFQLIKTEDIKLV
ncbi:MAG: hypothetical protein NT033_03625 [Candidatus Omnitrophica bacterium]|nr:hypothetical protein [Candidatus Omnitrophota bacterium]